MHDLTPVGAARVQDHPASAIDDLLPGAWVAMDERATVAPPVPLSQVAVRPRSLFGVDVRAPGAVKRTVDDRQLGTQWMRPR